MNPARRANLDVVRGVAILAVVGIHSFQATIGLFPPSLIPESGRTFVLVSYLRFGVELFYLLSGWLMFSIYRRNRVESGRQYLAKRTGRIWPLWIAFSTLSFASLILQWQVSPVASRFTADSWIGWVVGFVTVLLFLGWLDQGLWNVPPGGWSIQVEIGHYSLFWFLRKTGDLVLIVSVLIGYSTFFVADHIFHQQSGGWAQSFAESWLRLGLFGTWPFFVAGGLTFIWWVKTGSGVRAFMELSGQARTLRVALIGLVLVIAWWVPIPYGMTYEAVLASAVLLGVSWVMVRWVRTRKLGALFGRYSYFMYFAHFWILQVLLFGIRDLTSFDSPENRGLFWATFIIIYAVTLALSLMLAVPSWKYFESKWINRTHVPRG